MVPYNLTTYLDEFSRALAGEIRTLLGEVGNLHEQKRSLQLYVAFSRLLMRRMLKLIHYTVRSAL